MGPGRPAALMLIFIGHAYTPRCASYTLSAFREAVRSALDEAGARTGRVYDPVFEFQNLETQVRGDLLAALRAAGAGLIDVSDLNPNVQIELGFLLARSAPVLVVKSHQSLERGIGFPFYAPAECARGARGLCSGLAPGRASAGQRRCLHRIGDRRRALASIFAHIRSPGKLRACWTQSMNCASSIASPS
jgi:hypothetical protein